MSDIIEKPVILCDADRTALNWALTLNDFYGIGFLWPTVQKHGPQAEFCSQVDRGLLVCRTRGVGDKGGYWITDLGREVVRRAFVAGLGKDLAEISV